MARFEKKGWEGSVNAVSRPIGCRVTRCESKSGVKKVHDMHQSGSRPLPIFQRLSTAWKLMHLSSRLQA